MLLASDGGPCNSLPLPESNDVWLGSGIAHDNEYKKQRNAENLPHNVEGKYKQSEIQGWRTPIRCNKFPFRAKFCTSENRFFLCATLRLNPAILVTIGAN